MNDDRASIAAGSVAAVLGCFMFLVWLAVVLVMVVSLWKIFTKAGKPGWAAIVPIYNVIVLLEIVGRPLWWVIMFFIPFVGIIFGIIVCLDLAKSFGKSAAYAVGLILLPIVFYPILGFGSAQYAGPSAKS